MSIYKFIHNTVRAKAKKNETNKNTLYNQHKEKTLLYHNGEEPMLFDMSFAFSTSIGGLLSL